MTLDPSVDDHVADEIAACLDAEEPRSFFLYAGAGSGKTRSLVDAVRHGTTVRGRELSLQGRQIAVITFTNAAANEIDSRLDFDSRVRVSTIHSFSWDLIREFQQDIREWVTKDLVATIAELESRASKAGSKKELDRLYRLERAKERASTLGRIRRFIYSPSGENRGRESLNHSQVITLTAHLLRSKPMLRQILVKRHPILFIDESQDTNKALLEALIFVAEERKGEFVLGLFGDSMQRIYTDGIKDIDESLPATWATPKKVMNHRSPARIVRLSNRIRSDVDTHVQEARADRGEGFARLFLVSSDADVEAVESAVAQNMELVTNDSEWSNLLPSGTHSSDGAAVKRLILEHSMAAKRLGFAELYSILSALEFERTSLLDGSIAGLQVFLKQVLPLVDAHRSGDKFRVARLIREHSPLLSKGVLEDASSQEGALRRVLEKCQAAVDQIASLWDSNTVPTLGDIASVLNRTQLFLLAPAVTTALVTERPSGVNQTVTKETAAWQACLAVPFSEVVQYGAYVGGSSQFATHQGVKGLEFARVMVVISDSEARGFMFSYEKLFGVKPVSKTDAENRVGGNDTSLDRTRRLMYVTCSRATQSLAVVAYTLDPGTVRSFAIDNGWFGADEIVVI